MCKLNSSFMVITAFVGAFFGSDFRLNALAVLREVSQERSGFVDVVKRPLWGGNKKCGRCEK